MPATVGQWHAGLVVFLALTVFLATGTLKPARAQDDLAVKQGELQLKKDELEFRKQEAAAQRALEGSKTNWTAISVIVGAVAVMIPVWIAANNARAQRKISAEQARLTFQMKVAELALSNSENATQAREKARALASLFAATPFLPHHFAERFDPKLFRLDYGNSNKRREQVITLVAQHPKQRDQILEDWFVLFWWDQWWVEPLLNADDLRLAELRQATERLRANERNVNAANQVQTQPNQAG